MEPEYINIELENRSFTAVPVDIQTQTTAAVEAENTTIASNPATCTS